MILFAIFVEVMYNKLVEGLNITIKFSNRKTLQISVKDCAVTVRAPIGCSNKSIDAFISQKSAWIASAVAKQSKHLELKQALIDSGMHMLRGESIFVSTNDELRELYRHEFSSVVDRLYAYANVYDFAVSKVATSKAMSLWGACRADNAIRLNVRLVMLPQELRDYVILHELAHTVHHDHSKHFWALLEKICPECKKRRAMLKQYAWLFDVECVL